EGTARFAPHPGPRPACGERESCGEAVPFGSPLPVYGERDRVRGMAAHSLEAAELIEQRPDERLDTSRLEPYLRERLPGTEGSLSVRQFYGGKANLTYLLRFGDLEFVLRRPPLGPIPTGAHDMRREHRVLSVLHRCFPP